MRYFHSFALAIALVTAQVAAVKQLFHVTAPKPVFDFARHAFGDELDIWHARSDGETIKADIYATEVSLQKLYGAFSEHRSLRPADGSPLIFFERDAVNTQNEIAAQAAANANCTASTRRHLSETNATKYTDNAFFNCWRSTVEVFAFFDTLVSENPTIFSKTAKVSTTIEGRSIPAYTLSTGKGKKAIYVEGLIHPREWHAGSTMFYTMAGLLDAVRNNDTTIKPVVDQYDWVFVPIVNVDGYIFTHASSANRLWRKNRRQISNDTYGINLNRNWGPKELFGKGEESPSSDSYPGTGPLSEPETAGLYAFLKTLPLAGVLDIHSYGGLVLRPFANQKVPAPAPYGDKLKTLGDNVKNAIQVSNPTLYTSETASELNLSFGSLLDSVFLEFNHTATLAFEMEGDTFLQPASVIRPGGQHVFQGIVQFARELPAYYDTNKAGNPSSAAARLSHVWLTMGVLGLQVLGCWFEHRLN